MTGKLVQLELELSVMIIFRPWSLQVKSSDVSKRTETKSKSASRKLKLGFPINRKVNVSF